MSFREINFDRVPKNCILGRDLYDKLIHMEITALENMLTIVKILCIQVLKIWYKGFLKIDMLIDIKHASTAWCQNWHRPSNKNPNYSTQNII